MFTSAPLVYTYACADVTKHNEHTARRSPPTGRDALGAAPTRRAAVASVGRRPAERGVRALGSARPAGQLARHAPVHDRHGLALRARDAHGDACHAALADRNMRIASEISIVVGAATSTWQFIASCVLAREPTDKP